jgi:hypothetical protein
MAADLGERAKTPLCPPAILFLTRIVDRANRSHDTAPSLRKACQRDRDDQGRAIEQGFDEERPAELLDT